jgi:alpha-galactosidase
MNERSDNTKNKCQDDRRVKGGQISSGRLRVISPTFVLLLRIIQDRQRESIGHFSAALDPNHRFFNPIKYTPRPALTCWLCRCARNVMSKLILIGAGSAHYGPALVGDLLSVPLHLRDTELWLVDTNPDRLSDIACFAGRVNESIGNVLDIRATTDRAAALNGGADVIILTLDVDRVAGWQRDWQMPLMHGVRHINGDNGGPAALAHALRSIPALRAVAHDIARLAPATWVLNATGPLGPTNIALRQILGPRVAGFGAGIAPGLALIHRAMGWPGSAEVSPTLTRNVLRRVRVSVAGLSQFSFFTEIADKRTGEDLYPKVQAGLAALPQNEALLARRLFDTFGLLCASGRAAGEFLGFAAETETLAGPDFAALAQAHAAQTERMRQVAAGRIAPAYEAVKTSSERIVPVALALLHGLTQVEPAVTVHNGGAMPDLPDDAMIESSVTIEDRDLRAGPSSVPRGLLALLQREAHIQALIAQAAIHNDQTAMLQALMLDSHIRSYAQATHLLEDILAAGSTQSA